MSIWVLTREINEYYQEGEYFEHAWDHLPTRGELAGVGIKSESLQDHLYENGGDRIGYENTWYHLKEIV